MKKLLAILILCAMLVCLFAACEGNKETEPDTYCGLENAPEATESNTDSNTEVTESLTQSESESGSQTESATESQSQTESVTVTESESETDAIDVVEKVASALAGAAEHLYANRYFIALENTNDVCQNPTYNELLGGTERYEMTVAGNRLSVKQNTDGAIDNYVYLNNIAYNEYTDEDGNIQKIRFTYTDEELDAALDECISYYDYTGIEAMFDTVTCTRVGDTLVITLGDVSDEYYEGIFYDLSGSMSMEITLDAEGRIVRFSNTTIIMYTAEYVGADVTVTTYYTVDFSYFAEGEIEISAPDDADEYEEYVPETDSESIPAETETELAPDHDDSALVEASQYMVDNPYFTVEEYQVSHSDNPKYAEYFDFENSYLTVFAGNACSITYTLGDGWCDDYWYVDNCIYNKFGYTDDELTKYKATLSDEEYSNYFSDLLLGYTYEGEAEMFRNMTVTENPDDGSVSYTFTELTAAARENYLGGLDGELILIFVLDSEGRIAEFTSYSEIIYTVDTYGFNATVSETDTLHFTYGGDELVVIAPGDADEFTEQDTV